MRGTLALALPFAVPVFLFGTIYGTTAGTLLGPGVAVASSILVFSGGLQFATIGLIAVGASPAAIVVTALLLNARHVLLGAVLRPHVAGGLGRRLGVAWFLIDEATALALARPERAVPTLLVAGTLLYAAWVGGTVVGVFAGAVFGLETLASAAFPVLFVALSSLFANTRDRAVRAVVAGLIALVLAMAVPWARGLVPIVVAVATALPAAPAGRRTEVRA